MTGSEARADRVLVAMSGGVDSSEAAKLLRDAGYECTGCTMKLYRNEDAGVSRSRTCCSLEDIEDARSAAFRLGIPYYVFNFTEEFREKVIGKFVASYCRGLTPNPCIDCNRYLKFGALFQRADLLGCRYVATGHYARIDVQEGKYRLRKAADESKDQSYVLYMLTQEQLARTLFPLGELRKEEVRNLAEQAGLGNARKPDSQDICFVPDGDYARVIELHTGRAAEPGNFVSPDGTVLGQHRGLSAIPWASTAVWGSHSRSGAASAGFARRTTRWSWGRSRSFTAGTPWQRISTGSPERLLLPPSAAASGSVTASGSSRRR